ncbi:serine hydrolase [Pseudomonas sp. RIT623]|uniref:serine hydrolase n=1 Tax=Pseudomonas sp. RIT623 TaxID=2559075 RepID=UPI001C49B2BB|nr:serine hydrolase [Pseudomonas sp. RIT623]
MNKVAGRVLLQVVDVVRFKAMKKIRRVYWLLLLQVFIGVAGASADEWAGAPGIAAQAWILMDADSGAVLTEGNADTPVEPASLVKIMTSYLLGQALKSGALLATDKVYVGTEAWAAGNPVLQGSSLMFLKRGDQVSVAELNKGMVVASGNDACIALANYLAGSQDGFVKLMNEAARTLGLSNTTFKTVHGLAAPGQFSSARDMAVLSRALIHDLPEEYALFKERAFTFNGVHQYNRNRLLWSTSLQVDGLKTGNSREGGFSLVASAVSGNRRLIAVVMGADSDHARFQETEKLLKWGLRAFETAMPIKANEVFIEKRAWFGAARTVRLNAGERPAITVPYGKADAVKISAILNEPYLRAPLRKGQVVGVVNFQLDALTIAQKPLVVMETVEQAGWFSRLWDAVLLKLHQWLGVCVACAV